MWESNLEEARGGRCAPLIAGRHSATRSRTQNARPLHFIIIRCFSLSRSTQGVNYLFDRKLMEMPHALGLIKATTAAAAAVGVRRLIIILYARAHSAASESGQECKKCASPRRARQLCCSIRGVDLFAHQISCESAGMQNFLRSRVSWLNLKNAPLQRSNAATILVLGPLFALHTQYAHIKLGFFTALL